MLLAIVFACSSDDPINGIDDPGKEVDDSEEVVDNPDDNPSEEKTDILFTPYTDRKSVV